MIGVEVLQAEGPTDSRPHGPSTSLGSGGASGGHGLFGGARGLFGSSFGGGNSGSGSGSASGGGSGASGLEALSVPMMLQLRPSKSGLCKVRAKGGPEESSVESTLASLARGSASGGGGGGSAWGGGGGAGTGDALAMLASVQPLAKLAQLRYEHA